MAQGYAGNLMLLALEETEGGGTYTTILGMRDTSISINQNTVDTTSKDSAGVRQLLDAQTLRSVSISGSGVFVNDDGFNILRDAAMAGNIMGFKVTIPGTSAAGGTYTGQFAITSLEESGSYNGEVQYSISLESAGTVTWADAT